MTNLLIISYHALPLDVVASYRTKGYCDYLFEYGIVPTLVTHRWEKTNSNEWVDHRINDQVFYEKNKTHNVIRLPRPQEYLGSKSSLNTLKYWIRGDFDLHLLNSYKVFKKFLFKHLQENKYDVVLAIYSPHYHLKLAYEIHQKFKIPYVLDFRDLWDNQVVTKSYDPSLKKKVQDFLIKFYWKKWLKESLFFSMTSDIWINYLKSISGKYGIKVANGHEIREFEKKKLTKKFRLAYFGKLYHYQSFEVLINGLNKFLIHKGDEDDFEVLLIGTKKVDEFDGAAVLKSKIVSQNVFEIDYMPKESLLKLVSEHVSMFFLPNLKEDNGSFFVKLYDYIALNKPVILAPQNGSENDKVIKKLNAGLVTDSSSEVADYLNQAYKEFIYSGSVKHNVNVAKIKSLHRANQVKKLADQLRKELNQVL